MYSPLYCFDIIELGHFFYFDSVGLQDAVGCFTRRRIAFEEHEIHSIQIFRFDLGFFGKFVVGRTDKYEPVNGHLDYGQAAARFCKRQYPEFDSTVQHITHDFCSP